MQLLSGPKVTLQEICNKPFVYSYSRIFYEQSNTPYVIVIQLEIFSQQCRLSLVT